MRTGRGKDGDTSEVRRGPGDQGVRAFVIHGRYRFQDRHFLAYGLDYTGAQAAMIGIPQRKRWPWSRPLRVQRGDSAEQILWTLMPLIHGELAWLGSHRVDFDIPAE